MYKNILIGLFVFLVLLSGITVAYAVAPDPVCQEGEWDSELQRCIFAPGVRPPGEKIGPFIPSIAVYFKIGVTENQAKDLIESFGLTKYRLVGPEAWERREEGIDFGGGAYVKFPEGTEEEYIQKFNASDIVYIAQSDAVYQAGGQDEKQRGYNNIILVIGGIAVIIFALFLVWYKFFKRLLNK